MTTSRQPLVRFPAPLKKGDLIAVTAPSSGVQATLQPRLDLVLNHLRSQGWRVVEGDCLRQEHKDASAPATARAAELMRFLTDPSVAAVMPPWGGELATELLERIDFAALGSLPPKWFVGFSDLSTLHLPLGLLSGWATVHGPNLMDLAPTQTDPLTRAMPGLLGADFSHGVLQQASDLFQTRHIDFAVQHDAPLQLTEPTRWRRLDGSDAALEFSGHLIGGCLDTIVWLAGTRYGDVPGFVQRCGKAGTILYLENVEMNPPALVRALWALRRHGWFQGLNGVLIGRNAGPRPDAADRLSDQDALTAVLGGLPFPTLVDVDIGHRPPQFSLINGAFARVRFAAPGGDLWQAIDAPPSGSTSA